MELIWQAKAIKQMKKIGDRKLRERISSTVDQLECVNRIEDCAAIKKLRNHRYGYRMRVGDWRVLIDVVEGEPVVSHIEEVKKRDEHTY